MLALIDALTSDDEIKIESRPIALANAVETCKAISDEMHRWQRALIGDQDATPITDAGGQATGKP